VTMKSFSAAAPCSTANLGPGYDVFGLALDALEDRVKVSRTYSGGGRITIKNSDQAIPSIPESNSAGLVVKKMMEDFEISDSTEGPLARVLAAVLLQRQLLPWHLMHFMT
jgi:homoserine kinase